MESPVSSQAPTSFGQELEDPAKYEKLLQIQEIRSTTTFRSYKTLLSILAILLSMFHLALIHFFDVMGYIAESKRYIVVLVLLLLFSLTSLMGLYAILTEHLILILIYDIINKVMIITFIPLVCLQAILLNGYIKELDKIHKLKHKK